MLKMALSAMMRQLMPTTPLEGIHVDSGWKSAVAVAAFMACSCFSFEFPIRISGVLDVPEGSATFDRWNFSEIELQRRRTCGPFQRPGIPGIVSGRPAFVRGAEKVEDEDEDSNCLEENAHS